MAYAQWFFAPCLGRSNHLTSLACSVFLHPHLLTEVDALGGSGVVARVASARSPKRFDRARRRASYRPSTTVVAAASFDYAVILIRGGVSDGCFGLVWRVAAVG